MAYDVLLDSATGDLTVPSYIGSGPDVTRQRLGIRLRTLLGEWFLDQTVGIPLLTWLSEKGTSHAAISARVRAEVAGCPGVVSVTSWGFVWTASTGTLTLTGDVQIEGETASTPVTVSMSTVGGNFLPFVVFARMAKL
jgi:hypothetical protein